MFDCVVGGVKKGLIVFVCVVLKKCVVVKGKVKATATVKIEDAGARRSARGVKIKVDDEFLEMSLVKCM